MPSARLRTDVSHVVSQSGRRPWIASTLPHPPDRGRVRPVVVNLFCGGQLPFEHQSLAHEPQYYVHALHAASTREKGNVTKRATSVRASASFERGGLEERPGAALRYIKELLAASHEVKHFIREGSKYAVVDGTQPPRAPTAPCCLLRMPARLWLYVHPYDILGVQIAEDGSDHPIPDP